MKNRTGKKSVDYKDILENFSFLAQWNGIINEFFIDEKYSGDSLRAVISLKNKIKKRN